MTALKNNSHGLGLIRVDFSLVWMEFGINCVQKKISNTITKYLR